MNEPVFNFFYYGKRNTFLKKHILKIPFLLFLTNMLILCLLLSYFKLPESSKTMEINNTVLKQKKVSFQEPLTEEELDYIKELYGIRAK